MKNALTLAGRTCALTLITLSATQALAGSVGSVTHTPNIAGVPMLGGAGLVMLSALLGLISFRFLKDRGRKGGTLVIAATLTGAIAAAGGGFTLINEAQAQKGVLLSNNAGGTVELPFEGFNLIVNDTSVPQQIEDISTVSGCFVQKEKLQLNGGFVNGGGNGGLSENGGGSGAFRGTCSDEGNNGTVLQPDDRCEVLVCCGNGGGNGGMQGGNGGCFTSG